jgi:glycosyltransferase involved in cell wall biosynthesis
MVHGVPVVASAIGGVPESLDDGAAGLSFPPGDYEALAARIVEVAANRESTLARVRHAERFVRARYLKPAILRAHECAYAAALRRHSAAPANPPSFLVDSR